METPQLDAPYTSSPSQHGTPAASEALEYILAEFSITRNIFACRPAFLVEILQKGNFYFKLGPIGLRVCTGLKII